MICRDPIALAQIPLQQRMSRPVSQVIAASVDRIELADRRRAACCPSVIAQTTSEASLI